MTSPHAHFLGGLKIPPNVSNYCMSNCLGTPLGFCLSRTQGGRSQCLWFLEQSSHTALIRTKGWPLSEEWSQWDRATTAILIISTVPERNLASKVTNQPTNSDNESKSNKDKLRLWDWVVLVKRDTFNSPGGQTSLQEDSVMVARIKSEFDQKC